VTDAEYEAQKARVRAAIARWDQPLGLRWWKMRYEYAREHDNPGCDEVSRRVARCWTSWQYLEATIRFYLPALVDLDDAEVEQTVVHEMCHVLLNEMRELRHDAENWLQHEERTATVLAKAFLWTADLITERLQVAQPDPLVWNG
jgi:hypothetical protein